MTTSRVLLITGEYPPIAGGVSDYTAMLKSALDGTWVKTVVLSGLGSSADEIVDAWKWDTIRHVRDTVRRHDIDIVHIQYQAGAFGMHPGINLLPALLGNTPVVTTFHDLRPPYLFPKAGRLRFFAMKRMARLSSARIVTNPRDERMLANAGIPTILIPLGPSLPPPDATVESGRAIGYFGFPSQQKGFHLLIEALGHIPAAARPPLAIVGGKPPSSGQHGFMAKEDVRLIADRHGVHVTWTGFLPANAASNALARCAAVVFPFPGGATQRSSALIASLQTGRPVITTCPVTDADLQGLSQLPQLIQIPRGDTLALRNALTAAFGSPVGWQPLPAEYAWPSIGARHAALYQTLLRKVHR